MKRETIECDYCGAPCTVTQEKCEYCGRNFKMAPFINVPLDPSMLSLEDLRRYFGVRRNVDPVWVVDTQSISYDSLDDHCENSTLVRMTVEPDSWMEKDVNLGGRAL